MSDTYATLIEAPMGGGKTTTATGFAVDKYFENIYAIESPSNNIYNVAPYGLDSVRLLQSEFVSKENVGKLIKLPANYLTHSKIKIFCNYHLYGVRYMYAPMSKVLDYVNTPIMEDAIWIIDESYMEADARKGMNPMTIFLTQYSQSMRKRRIDLYYLIQHGRFLDWRVRYITKRKILTKYNEKTHQVKLLVQDLAKQTEKSISYDPRIYWKYFDTHELPPMPQASIDSARRYS